MKLKTADLTGPALRAAVALAQGWTPDDGSYGYIRWTTPDHNTLSYCYCPDIDWSQGGPIIERERIELFPHLEVWGARRFSRDYIKGPTPLIAAMRCFVASKLGDEVDIPEELCL